MKYSTRASHSIFTINRMNAKKEVFDNYIWKEKEEFEKIFKDLKENHNSSDHIVVEKEKLTTERKILLEDGYELFLVGRGIVRVRNRKAMKLYFENFDSKTTKGNLRSIHGALSNALVLMKNDEFNELDNFKEEFEVMVSKIATFLSDKAERLSDLEEASSARKTLEDKWYLEYKSLKRFLKAYFTKRKDHDYRYFFEDLYKKPSSSSNSKKEEEVVENLNETPEIIETPLENN